MILKLFQTAELFQTASEAFQKMAVLIMEIHPQVEAPPG